MWGVIDIGSNTVRLVAYALEDGRLRPKLNKKYAAGLAGYVDAVGNIQEEGVRRLIEILLDIRALLEYVRLEAIFPFATAFLRNSVNGPAVLERVQAATGFSIRILTGEEEALFDYYGILYSQVNPCGLAVDVGGGSTELAFFMDKQPVLTTSIPWGSLNLYKAFVSDLMPTPQEARQIRREIQSRLERLDLPLGSLISQPIYSVGGTARASLALLSREYKRLAGKNGYTLADLRAYLQRAQDKPREILRGILCASPDRVHTILPGLLVFETVAKYCHTQSFIISDYGVREGYLSHVLKERGDLHA